MINQTKNGRNQKGFTLVELAIVLVIIGLIVSSVLVGQDLIKAAQIRATIRQLNEFQVGVNTFIGKYNGLPGDLSAASAASFFGTYVPNTGTNVANGDGTITSSGGGVAAYTGEIGAFWAELTMPGKELISGTFTSGYLGAACSGCVAGVDFPAMKYGSSGWGVYGASGLNYFFAGAAATSSNTDTTMANPFVPLEAYNIDSKIDDGLPTTGDVMAGGGSTLTSFVTTLAPSTSCSNGGVYVMTTNSNACALQFKMQTF